MDLEKRRIEERVPEESLPKDACSVAKTSRITATGGSWPSI
jgi:hypothetical protein